MGKYSEVHKYVDSYTIFVIFLSLYTATTDLKRRDRDGIEV